MKKKAMSRSENMARIRSKNTEPEMAIRKLLYHHGYRYRLHRNDLPGKPDLYLGKYKTAIFINGCFWHVHEDCSDFKLPKSNREFWEDKLKANKVRDQKNYSELIENGINVVVVWECTIKKHLKNDEDQEFLLTELSEAIHSEKAFDEICI